MKKTMIFGWIGVVWGILILINTLCTAEPTKNAGQAYASGSSFGTYLGGLLLLAGAVALWRYYRARWIEKHSDDDVSLEE